jgi:hypothetical protein
MELTIRITADGASVEGASVCEEAGRLWSALTVDELLSPLAGQGAYDLRARRIVRHRLGLSHPIDQVLFSGNIPLMLRQVGVDAHKPPEHLINDLPDYRRR